MRSRARLLVLLLALIAPTVAAADTDMVIEARVVLNGAAAPAGTSVEARGENDTLLGEAAADAEGRVRLVLPADERSTAAKEGAAPGEAITFHARGGTARGSSLAFEAGSTRSGVTLSFTLPDLALEGVRISDHQPQAGETLVVTGVVANRAATTATGVVVRVEDASGVLASSPLGVLAGAERRAFSLQVNTTAMAGETALHLATSALEGDFDPATGTQLLSLDVQGAAGAHTLAHTPPHPRAGEPVSLALSLAEGASADQVQFFWSSGTPSSTAVQDPPYRATIGAFDAGASVRYWAVIVQHDGSTLRTAEQRFDVTAAAEDVNETPPSPTAGPTTAPPVEADTPLPLGLALLAGAAAALARKR